MDSSISNFDRRFDSLPWLRILVSIACLLFLFIGLMEFRLYSLGYHSTALDSKARWSNERMRASQLGRRALILIGASRIQLGMDLDKLRSETGLEPIQLAIDGSSFIPILRGLAKDDEVTGTIIVDYSPAMVAGAGVGASEAFEQTYEDERMRERAFFSLTKVEAFLTDRLHEHMRSYADGTTPLIALLDRIFPSKIAKQYLVTLPDRSRLANYKMVTLPGWYYGRVARNLGIDGSIDATAPNVEKLLMQKINLIQPSNNADFIAGAEYLKKLKAAIEARGGKVLFMEMPTTGMIRQIDEKSYPRSTFLDVFEQKMGVKVLVAADDPKLKQFTCPDGSHLDFRDRTTFTHELINSLGMRK